MLNVFLPFALFFSPSPGSVAASFHTVSRRAKKASVPGCGPPLPVMNNGCKQIHTLRISGCTELHGNLAGKDRIWRLHLQARGELTALTQVAGSRLQ